MDWGTWLHSESCHNLVLALLHTLWQGVLLLVALSFVLKKVSPQRAELRYLLAVAAMTLILAGGFITWSVLEHEAPFSSTREQSTATASGSDSQAVEPTPVVPAPKNSTSPKATPATVYDQSLRWTLWFLPAWIAGAAIMLARMGALLWGAGRLCTRAEPLQDEGILSVFQDCQQCLGITRPVRVLISEKLTSPAVVGIVWPTILLPVSVLSGVPAESLRAALAHELAHIRRYDYLVNCGQMIIEAVLFFNPAIWWISRQVRIEREACCDLLASNLIGEKEVYARALTDWATRFRLPQPALAFSDEKEPGTLLDRVKRLLVANHRSPLRLNWYAIGGVFMLSCLILTGLYFTGNLTVALAGKIFTPQQRVEKMTELAETHVPEDLTGRSYPKEDWVTLSGTVRTWDGKELPQNSRLSIQSTRYRSSCSGGERIDADGTFSSKLDDYYKMHYVIVNVDGYAPGIAGPFETEPGGQVENIDIVLQKGFAGRLRVVGPSGEPVRNAQIKAHYNLFAHSWSSAQSLPDMTSDETGTAVIEHCLAHPLEFEVLADGYQWLQKINVTMTPKDPSTISLQTAEATTGVVVAQRNGEPIAHATFQVRFKNRPGHGWNFGEFGPTMATTNELGRFTLASLQESCEFSFIVEAERYRPAFLKDITMGDQGIQVELSQPVTVSGKVLGDLDQLSTWDSDPIIYWTGVYEDTRGDRQNLTNSKHAFVNQEDRRFLITGFPGNLVRITAGEKRVNVEISDQSIDDLIIDLNPLSEMADEVKREVIIRLEVPEGSPQPAGSLRVERISEKRLAEIGHMEAEWYPVEDGEIHLEVGVPGRVRLGLSWDHMKRLAGYWISAGNRDEWMHGIKILGGEEPYLITVPAHPAGAIYGQIAGLSEKAIKELTVEVLLQDKPEWLSEHHIHFRRQEYGDVADGKFNLTPLPLDARYILIARTGASLFVTDPIKLTAKRPIRELNFEIPDGFILSGQVVYPDGTPAQSKPVNLKISMRFGQQGWSNSGDRTDTDAEGWFEIRGMNPDWLDAYELNVAAGRGYQDIRQKLRSIRKPIHIVLQKGETLSGVVLDEETGWPIPNATVYARTTDQYRVVQADGRTTQSGEFYFSKLGDLEYYVGVDDTSSQKNIIINGGQKKPITLRVKIYDKKLKPRRPEVK
jgi:beta-lactamase regulating signal transducer with metallopeptidase domain